MNIIPDWKKLKFSNPAIYSIIIPLLVLLIITLSIMIEKFSPFLHNRTPSIRNKSWLKQGHAARYNTFATEKLIFWSLKFLVTSTASRCWYEMLYLQNVVPRGWKGKVRKKLHRWTKNCYFQNHKAAQSRVTESSSRLN